MGFSYTQRSGSGKKLQPPVFNGNDMVVLSEKNFSNFMTTNRHVVVVFYRWRVAPEHAALAKKLTGAAVDIDEDHRLAEKNKIVGSPAVYFFPGGADLGDKYFNEWISELDPRERVKGKFIGKLVRGSDEEGVENDKNDRISTDSSTGYRQFILQVADPPKIVNRKPTYEEDEKWDGVSICE